MNDTSIRSGCEVRGSDRTSREHARPRQGLGQVPQVTYQVRFTEEAEADLVRLYEFILAMDETPVGPK